MTFSKTNLFLFIVIGLLITSCTKRRGCTDYEALNYSSEAKKNDFNCIYETWGVIYWEDYYYQNYMLDSGSVTIYAYLDGKYIGSKPASNIGNNYIDCYETGELTFTDTVYYDYQYKQLLLLDEDDRVVYLDTVLIENSCNYIYVSN